MEPINQNTNSNNSSKTIMILLGGVLVLIIIVILAYMLSHKNEELTQPPIQTAVVPTQVLSQPTAVDVSISKDGFSPASVLVPMGSTVTWKNQDALGHGLALDLKTSSADLTGFSTDESLAQSDSYTFTFNTSGRFDYYDPQNPSIKGTIIVK